MANSTWNFQVHEARDWPDNPSGRGRTSGIFYTHGSSSTPFNTAFTGIFSVLMKTGWTSFDGAPQGLFSVARSGVSSAVSINLVSTATEPKILIAAYDCDTATLAHDLYLGDEDGSNWMSADKWYQIAYSVNSSGVSFAVNGTASPKYAVSTDNPSIFKISTATRAGVFGAPVSLSATFLELSNVGQVMPSCMVGPAAYANRYIDLTDSAVLARIYDSDGNFRNPGEDGSLWFGDTYGDVQPDYYFASGSPRVQNGTDTTAWYVAGSNNYTGRIGGPGGLRKQYE